MMHFFRRVFPRRLPLALAPLLVALSGCGDSRGAPPPIELPERPRISAEEAMRMPFPRAPGDPGSVDFEGLGYHDGPATARVTVVEFSDFGCPHCARFALDTYPELRREFIDTGLVRWIFVPFVMGNFANGDLAARAGECARELGDFPAMKDRIYQGQREWRSGGDPAALFTALAEDAGLDGEEFGSCYASSGGSHRTRDNNSAAATLAVRATPTFFIEGRRVEGALPEEHFRELLTRMTSGAGR